MRNFENISTIKNCTAVIIVLYFPDLHKIYRLIKSFEGEKTSIVFIDNTPELINQELVSISKSNYNITYLPQKENRGIAEAQNIGIVAVKKMNGMHYVLFLDQDTNIENGFIDIMINEYLRIYKLGVSIAALGPTPLNEKTLKKYKQEPTSHKNKGDQFYKPSVLVSSGMFICLETLFDVGLMDSELFIDFVDFDWCWRAKVKGYECCMTERATIKHNVGIEEKFLFGFPLIISSPTRYYYQYRNFILLFFRSYVPFGWKIKNLFKKFFILFYLPLVSSQPKKVFVYIIRGIISGVKFFFKIRVTTNTF
jgi:rhamnosyltransferase